MVHKAQPLRELKAKLHQLLGVAEDRQVLSEWFDNHFHQVLSDDRFPISYYRIRKGDVLRLDAIPDPALNPACAKYFSYLLLDRFMLFVWCVSVVTERDIREPMLALQLCRCIGWNLTASGWKVRSPFVLPMSNFYISFSSSGEPEISRYPRVCVLIHEPRTGDELRGPSPLARAGTELSVGTAAGGAGAARTALHGGHAPRQGRTLPRHRERPLAPRRGPCPGTVPASASLSFIFQSILTQTFQEEDVKMYFDSEEEVELNGKKKEPVASTLETPLSWFRLRNLDIVVCFLNPPEKPHPDTSVSTASSAAVAAAVTAIAATTPIPPQPRETKLAI